MKKKKNALWLVYGVLFIAMGVLLIAKPDQKLIVDITPIFERIFILYLEPVIPFVFGLIVAIAIISFVFILGAGVLPK